MADLLLPDSVLVLAFRGSDGKRLVRSAELDLAVAGAQLGELVLAGALDVTDDRVRVRRSAAPADPELGRALDAVAAGPDGRPPGWWVRRLRSARTRDRLLDRLVSRGVLVAESRRLLGIIPVRRYRPGDPAVRPALLERLRSLAPEQPAPPRDAALAALLRACRLDRTLLDGDERDRLTAVAEGSWGPPALRAVVAAAGTAVSRNRSAAHSASPG